MCVLKVQYIMSILAVRHRSRCFQNSLSASTNMHSHRVWQCTGSDTKEMFSTSSLLLETGPRNPSRSFYIVSRSLVVTSCKPDCREPNYSRNRLIMPWLLRGLSYSSVTSQIIPLKHNLSCLVYRVDSHLWFTSISSCTG